MRWFGSSWGAPACDPGQHAPTPAGSRCWAPAGGCGELIGVEDQGVLLPYAETAREVALHLDCFLSTIGVGPRWTHGVVDCRGDGTSRDAAADDQS